MKQILLMIAVVMGQSVLAADKKLIADPIVEKEIRKRIKKPTGKYTKAELEHVTSFNSDGWVLTVLSSLAELTNCVIDFQHGGTDPPF